MFERLGEDVEAGPFAALCTSIDEATETATLRVFDAPRAGPHSPADLTLRSAPLAPGICGASRAYQEGLVGLLRWDWPVRS